MIVMKFGGTSVGSPQRMREVAELIHDGQPKVVVLSAVAGTTNKLADLAACLRQGDQACASDRLEMLFREYLEFVSDLLPGEQWRNQGLRVLNACFLAIREQFVPGFGAREENVILAQGELISTQLFQIYLQSTGLPSVMLPALDFMRTNAQGDPDREWIGERLRVLLASAPSSICYLTQGYICLNAAGEVDNLQRGGSDYTATLIGAALRAGEIQIWTDIDGLHDGDPRLVEGTRPVRQLSFREAAELAYFGAKILHPTCVIPAEEEGVPIRLKNTFAPEAAGTLIAREASGRTVAALAAKDGITAIRIQSGRMLNAYGFLRRVFEVFEAYRTPIDMITTSEVSVSLTIDHTEYLEDILRDLSEFVELTVDSGQTIICVVGDHLDQHTAVMREIFAALEHIPLRMVSYGGSSNNVSILVPSGYKREAMETLHLALFRKEAAGAVT